MGLLDFILNIAGVLLWMNWRSQRLDPLSRATPATLVGTIKKTQPGNLPRWQFALIIGALVCLRAFVYLEIGPAVNWTPTLDLGAIAPAFRSNLFSQQLLFSALSLLRALIIFYSWLLFLALVNRETNPDPVQKLILVQLGRPGRWPAWLQAILPIVSGALLWLAIYPMLARLGIINWAASPQHLAGQCFVVGAATILSLKFLLPTFLVLHLVVSYVYLGNNPIWEFINTTARNVLRPIDYLPLRAGKIDLAPVVGIGLIVVIFFYPLPELIDLILDKHQLTLWPA